MRFILYTICLLLFSLLVYADRTDKVVEISDLGNTIFNLSNNYPIVYGISSILLALVAGVAISFIRRKVSRWKAQRNNQPAMY